MLNRREVKIWMHRDLIAFSLRKLAETPSRIQKMHKGALTDAQLRRAQEVMVEQAAWHEAKAAKLAAEPAAPSAPTEETPT